MGSEDAALRPAVTVCIANYNGEGLIEECIQSVRSQRFRHSVEIIVHDDASTDASVHLIRTRYPDVILLESSNNVGFCIANNRMVEESRGDYVLLLNNDASLEPDAIDTLYQHASRLNRPAILTLPQFDHENGELIDRGCFLDPFFNPVPNLDDARNDVAMVIGACFWIPRCLWQELGGFPEWFGSIAEDMYLCCLARLRDHPVQVCSTSGYRHRVGRSFGGGRIESGRLSTTLNRRALSEKNKAFTMLVSQPLPLLLFLLPIHFVLFYFEGAILSLVNRNAELWAVVYGPLLQHLHEARHQLRQARQSAQATRVISMVKWLSAFAWTHQKLTLLYRHGLPEIR